MNDNHNYDKHNHITIERKDSGSDGSNLTIWINDAKVFGCSQVVVDALGNVSLTIPTEQLTVETSWEALKNHGPPLGDEEVAE